MTERPPLLSLNFVVVGNPKHTLCFSFVLFKTLKTTERLPLLPLNFVGWGNPKHAFCFGSIA